MMERYRRWFEHEQHAHAKVLDSLHTVPGPARSDPQFQRAMDLFGHLLAARRLWLFRFGVARTGPNDLSPADLSFDALDVMLAETDSAWTDWFSNHDSGELARSFEYRAHEGDRYRNTVEDILAQLFAHSAYHRGQIALLVRDLGGEPAVTDFVFWAREPLDA